MAMQFLMLIASTLYEKFFMNEEIFYLYRFKQKCPYRNPLIQTMLLVLCVSLCVAVSIDRFVDACLLYLVFVVS